MGAATSGGWPGLDRLPIGGIDASLSGSAHGLRAGDGPGGQLQPGDLASWGLVRSQERWPLGAGLGLHPGSHRCGSGEAERPAGACSCGTLGCGDRVAAGWPLVASGFSAASAHGSTDRPLVASQLDHQPRRHQPSRVRVSGPGRRSWCLQPGQLAVVPPPVAGAAGHGASGGGLVGAAALDLAAPSALHGPLLVLALAPDQSGGGLGAHHVEPEQRRPLHRSPAPLLAVAPGPRVVAMGPLVRGQAF